MAAYFCPLKTLILLTSQPLKKLLSLLICLPFCAAAQQDDISVGIGASFCSPLNNSAYALNGSKATPVPDVQVAYLKGLGKHYQLGLSLGITSYRRKDIIQITDINSQPIGMARASFRFAEIAVPLKAEGRYIIPLKNARLFASLSAGVVICAGSKGASSPYNGSNPNAVPDPVVVAYNNLTALIAGVSAGYAHAINKHVQLGVTPTVNFVSGNFTIPNQQFSAGQGHFFDYQLHVVCSYGL